jgi:signal transduction histidine kinase
MARKRQRPRSGCTILVVDDQREALTSVRDLLEREGHQVLTADSGARALEIFKQHEIHLILVDYFMPGMTGEQLIRAIRSFDQYVQIILQTGYAGEKPARVMMAELDIQGYHDKTEGPEKLLLWVDAGLKAHRLLNQLRERERLQGEMVANVSHEFRTPLNIMGGYLELLLDGEFGALPPDAIPPLRGLTEATRNLGELVSNFLKYAKLESKVLDVHHEWICSDELGDECQRFGGLLTERKDVRFSVDVDDAPARLFTDSVKLRTILRNLITNAVKFTRQGTVALRIWADGDGVRFAVEDSGSGIKESDLEAIFEPFRQLDGSASREHRGVGLGLALSRKLARLLGGDIEVRSTPGVGSRFTLALPAEAAARPDVAEREVDHSVRADAILAAAV